MIRARHCWAQVHGKDNISSSCLSKTHEGNPHIVHGLGGRIAEEMAKNGFGTRTTLRCTPLQLSDPRSTAIQTLVWSVYRLVNGQPMLFPTNARDAILVAWVHLQVKCVQTLSNSKIVGQPHGDCLGFDWHAPVEFAIQSEDVNGMLIDASYNGQHEESFELGIVHSNKFEDCDDAAATMPVNHGSTQPLTEETHNSSELVELCLENVNNCDAQSDVGVNSDPAIHVKSCSHSTSPDLELVPSADNFHEPTHFSNPLQPRSPFQQSGIA
ncbi:hypothetical protein MJO28_015040 [Puccinia striiformis f. sp. tritici]|uniref:Uncharacterized protein n=1 Tax=Puccinia striiformis f. sp. tritici TaxID=168172 RepID=A0ACC0DRE7_9BASI|nr:hypothetical protein MJO28_015040 [Puccinia striiformis f. sp. tritici]